MRIVALTVEIEILEADSLKDKRQVVRSLLERARNKFNVSAAEVDQQDVWRRATLGFSAVSNDGKLLEHVMDRVLALIDSEPRCVVLEQVRERF
jgi:uncharacterized protein YlxP (DUF503 family)